MFHALLGRKVQVYYVSSYDAEYSLNCLIVNEQGCSESISVAKIDNKYYNVREKGVTDISIGLSTQSVNEEGLSMPFRGNQIDSEDFIRIVETFKSEVFLHPI